jgi:hypothetical protein
MNLKSYFSDPRRRNLAVLAVPALVGVLLAVFALDRRADEVAPKYPQRAYFPELDAKLGEVTRIHIESRKSGAFDVTFAPMKGWVLPGRNNYPASFEEVSRTLRSLAALQTIAPKTARPDWLHYVDLDAPPKGGGVLISLGDDKGRVLAALIVGKSEDIGDASGSVGLFVRKPGETQSWLVGSPFAPHASPSDWLKKNIVEVERARIQEVDVRPLTGPAYTVRRDKPGDTNFMLTPVPRGREPAGPGALDAVAAALADFTFDDIQPSANLDFDNLAWRTVTRTFDGLVVGADVIKQGSEYWARIYAGTAHGKPEAVKEARDINADSQGWAYRLSSFKGAQFMVSLDDLLAPLAKKSK